MHKFQIPQLSKDVILWIYPRNLPYLEISSEETKWKNHLSKFSFDNYRFTRGYLRKSLAKILKIDPLEVPLMSEPGKAPFLDSNDGFISISHTKEMLFLAFAPNTIGIDIENKYRSFKADRLVKRFFKENERKELSKIDSKNINKEVLKYWLIKESAYKWQSNKSSSDFFEWEWRKKYKFAVNKKKDLKVNTFFCNYQNYFLGVAYN